MFRIISFAVCLIGVVSSSVQNFQNQHLFTSIETVDNFKHSEEVNVLQEFTKNVNEVVDPSAASPIFKITYELGNRTAGDRLVGVIMEGLSWGKPRNYQFKLLYPKSSNDTVLTYVNIVAQQESYNGRSYVTTGGIGQSEITVIIESISTRSYLCKGEIYVRNNLPNKPAWKIDLNFK